MKIDDNLLDKIADDFIKEKKVISESFNYSIQMTFEQYLIMRLDEMRYRYNG